MSPWVLNLQGGGSGLNIIVVVNQCSSNSCELGNYYCERRQVPPENVLRICWQAGNISWTSNEFNATLLAPLLDMVAARGLTNQADYIVLSMDIPFQTSFGSTINGTTSALFYGLKSSSDSAVTNGYAASEAVFRAAAPTNQSGCSFLATMMTAETLAQAKQLVDQGVEGDGRNPLQPVILAKTSDPARNLRHIFFDNAIFNLKILGVSSAIRTNTDSVWWSDCLGLETGLPTFSLWPNTFATGSIADSMTSFGGVIFGPNSQTNLLAFIHAGAAGSYGTVAEPLTDTEKFPNPQVYFYQARGFSLAESYYQSVNAPFLGIIVGESLSAPFARRGSGQWDSGLSNAVLTGCAELGAQFHASDGGRPLQQVDLFVDGKYFKTMTNLAPCPGNRLTLNLNGYVLNYTVPTNATLETIAMGLAGVINQPDVTTNTTVRACAHGDRIELQSMAVNTLVLPFHVTDGESTNTPGSVYRVSYLPDSFPPEMTLCRVDETRSFSAQLTIPTPMRYTIQASTNLVDWLPIATNATPGLVDFKDIDAANYPQRFYRMVGPVPNQPPKVFAPAILEDGTFQMQVESEPGQPFAVQFSTNLVDWTSVITNQAGGAMVYQDNSATNDQMRVYRAWRVPPVPAAFAVLDGGTGAATQVRIDSVALPYVIEKSTNGSDWTAIRTNFSLSHNEITAGSEVGGGDWLSTFLTASQSGLLPSEAYGRRKYTVSGNSPATGAWIQLEITKTNAQTVVVGVTNQAGGATSAQLATQLCNLVNTNPALQGSDGIVAEDIATAASTTFNLRARNPGCQAAAVSVMASRSSSGQRLYIAPAFVEEPLTNNLADLQARNHLYVTAGADSLALKFPLDTTTLPDGHHELTAVAYEGSSVRTQTRLTVPVEIRNTSLSATLTLLDATNTASVNDTCHIEITANTNTVSNVTLFSTGGALATTNLAPATFEVIGTNLWAGLHPFYAVVETSDGLKYRTETRWVRFVNGQ